MEHPDYLQHHGILGQHWGVRRFQNPDGSWTTEGLKRRRSGHEKTTAKINKYSNERMIRDSIRWNKAINKGVIEKGTPLYRASTNRNETIDDHRKYVSISETGANTYINALKANNLYGQSNKGKKELTQYRYEASKDIKVAPIEVMRQAAVEKYNEDHPKLSKIQKFLSNEETLYNKSLFDAMTYSDTNDYKKQNDFYDRMYNLGYDAIPDLYDVGYKGQWGVTNGSMIFLKPYESMKLTDVYDLESSIEKGKSFASSIMPQGIENARDLGKLDDFKVR